VPYRTRHHLSLFLAASPLFRAKTGFPNEATKCLPLNKNARKTNPPNPLSNPSRTHFLLPPPPLPYNGIAYIHKEVSL
jgi:hypothetical protein